MAKVFASAALAGYRLFGFVARPAVPFILERRARRGKEDRARLGERYGEASRPRPEGRVAWVHAASVGETNAALTLVERIVAAGFSVVMTTVTVTSAKVAAAPPAGGRGAPVLAARFARRGSAASSPTGGRNSSSSSNRKSGRRRS